MWSWLPSDRHVPHENRQTRHSQTCCEVTRNGVAQAKSSYRISLANSAWIALHLPGCEQHGAIDCGLEELSLEAVLREWCSALHRCTCSRTGSCLVDCLAG